MADVIRSESIWSARQSGAAVGNSVGAQCWRVEYALRHPERVSRLVLMDPAPTSAADSTASARKGSRNGLLLWSCEKPSQTLRLTKRPTRPVVAYYRVHSNPQLARSECYEKLILRMQARFIVEGKEGILKSRAVKTGW